MDSLQIVGLPAFEDNYIWCLQQDGHVAVVDPGDAAPVLRHLAAADLQLAAILITHHHRDHTGGIGDLAGRFAVPVFGPARESIVGVTHPLAGGDEITLPAMNLSLAVLDVAGHTRGHIAYYRRGSLFCGDTMFGCGCGRLFEGTAAQLQAALDRIASLPTDTRIYCAHEYTTSGMRFAGTVEPSNAAVAQRSREVAAARARQQPTVPFTLADELATSPFLRCDAPEVIATVARRLGRTPADALETFAALRSWRDDF